MKTFDFETHAKQSEVRSESEIKCIAWKTANGKEIVIVDPELDKTKSTKMNEFKTLAEAIKYVEKIRTTKE